MTRQLEKLIEDKAKRQRDATLMALYGGLEKGVDRAGGELTGLSVRLRPGDVLLTIRALFPAGPMIAFVGAPDMPDAFVRGMKEASADALNWRVDNFKVE